VIWIFVLGFLTNGGVIMKDRLFTVFFFLFFLFFVVPMTFAQWTIQQVETNNDSDKVGFYPLIDTDSLNKVHIIYLRNDDIPKYATNAFGEWIIEEIPLDVAQFYPYASIDTDSLNKVHIIYGYNGLYYATNASGKWTKCLVDSSYGFVSTMIDLSDNVHIRYYNWKENCFKYATNPSSPLCEWQIDTIDCVDLFDYMGGVEDKSIAYDSSNKIHISYCGNHEDGALKYLTNKCGKWESESIDPDSGVLHLCHTSIAVDSTDNLHIVYESKNGENLKHATKDNNECNSNNSWLIEKIYSNCDLDGHKSIKFDSLDNIHVLFYTDCDGGIRYTTKAFDLWEEPIRIDSVEAAPRNYSIAIDSTDHVHVAYKNNDDLMYATNKYSNTLYTLEVIKNGSGIGTVTSNPDGIKCGDDCTHDYEDGNQISLLFEPDEGSVFAGCSCDNENSCSSITMDSDITCTVTFNKIQHTLQVNNDGIGGIITSDPPGIDCGSDCTEDYDYGTPVTLTAILNDGFVFAGWSGDCSGTDTCTVTMDANKTVSATFNELISATLKKAVIIDKRNSSNKDKVTLKLTGCSGLETAIANLDNPSVHISLGPNAESAFYDKPVPCVFKPNTNKTKYKCKVNSPERHRDLLLPKNGKIKIKISKAELEIPEPESITSIRVAVTVDEYTYEAVANCKLKVNNPNKTKYICR
jgi:uncharacterized repeat protein (TIGR02543 family)